MIGKENYRQKGYGKEVMNVIESLIRKLSMNIMVAKVNIQNVPSVKFFTKNGFKNTGIVNDEHILKKSV